MPFLLQMLALVFARLYTDDSFTFGRAAADVRAALAALPAYAPPAVTLHLDGTRPDVGK